MSRTIPLTKGKMAVEELSKSNQGGSDASTKEG